MTQSKKHDHAQDRERAGHKYTAKGSELRRRWGVIGVDVIPRSTWISNGYCASYILDVFPFYMQVEIGTWHR
jgi:hypothetical protein